MPEIENYSVYNDRMRRSMWDKAFFMDKIPGTALLIDYGCADGSLIQFLHELFPEMRFIGFDIDPDMIVSARARRIKNSWFFTDTAEMMETIRISGIQSSATTINFSSVFHEVFHYGYNLKSITTFIRMISPQYLVVRDMMYLSTDMDAVVPEKAVRAIKNALPLNQIQDFERIWGSISLRKNMIHFLLKYSYTENWDRECAENYFSYTEDQLTHILDPDAQYQCTFHSNYILPWIRYDLENRFGIDPGNELTTHFTMILSAQNRRKMISLNTLNPYSRNGKTPGVY